MIRIAIIGSIGSGKTYISKLFGFPVFNADEIVSKIYSEDKNVFIKLKKKLPNNFNKFPINKDELINTILRNKKNINKISSIIHPVVRKYFVKFLKINKKKKVVVLDIPLYLENKLNKKGDIIIFIHSRNADILKRIKKRKNYNKSIFQKLKKLQFTSNYKRKKSHFTIKNDFNRNSTRKKVKDIIKMINHERNCFRY